MGNVCGGKIPNGGILGEIVRVTFPFGECPQKLSQGKVCMFYAMY